MRLRVEASNDHALVAAAVAGDDAAFEMLARRHQGAVRGLLRRLSRDYAAADDLAQLTFVKAWQKLATFRDGNFLSWLCAIAYRMWLQELRKPQHVSGGSETDIESAAAKCENPGRDMDIDRALIMLPAEQRQAVLLSFMAGMSHAEIVALTGWPLGTVKSHIARGKAKLHALLEGYSHAKERA